MHHTYTVTMRRVDPGPSEQLTISADGFQPGPDWVVFFRSMAAAENSVAAIPTALVAAIEREDSGRP